MTWSDEDLYSYDAEEGPDDDAIPCRICSRLIGDEVAYGDNWGEGPICECCSGTCGHRGHAYTEDDDEIPSNR